MRPEEILAVYQAGPEALIELINRLLEQIQSLEDQLAQNSHNSSRPPCSDSFKRPVPKSRRELSGRSVGGQKGHEGHTLKMVENPDHTQWYWVDACEHCGSSLEEVEASDYERRQEFDLPPLQAVVTEHRVQIKACPCCGKLTKAAFPESIQQPVQYSNRLRAIAVYLTNYQLVPYQRMRELFEDLFSHSLSEGTLVNANNSCSERLEPAEKAIKEQLIHSSVVHFDETGCPSVANESGCMSPLRLA